MNDIHEHGDLRGWGYGLAAWILAAYTNPNDTVLDLDNDPGVRLSALTMDRGFISTTAPAVAVPGSSLVTAHWPRPSGHEPGPTSQSDLDALTDIAGLLAPGGRLGLVMSLPAPVQPFTLHTGDLLAAAFDAGLGPLRAVHGVAIAHRDDLEPSYRCALIFRRPGRRAGQDGDASAEQTHG